MKTSTDRILTTQVGSLARPHSPRELMRDRFQGKPVGTSPRGGKR